ncbi:restriction endonuclease subunit S [Bifidobacterium longum]|uniref:restriction endonuclease subunit S n=1 Tax=Bifidobacterium longum TaxID=216816 RepID=UPI000C3112D1|nr:restriction endonuclease S subunit [Bifidobacterium longum]
MAEQAKVPAIRFAGFTDPWEQRKLSEVATFGGGHTPPMADPDNYEDGYVLWVTSQDVKSNYLDRTTTQITEKGAKELTLYPAGSLVMVTRSGILRHTLPVAELRKPSTVNQDIRVILPQGECCGEWLLQFFISHNKELLLEFGKTGTTVESVDFGKIKDMLLYMPSTVEQQQIGDFFAKLDSLITLHQRKYDKLVIFKKSMLEKMFPKDGESVPEIRFAGFTDPWEQRKFSEIVDVCSGRDYKQLDGGPIPVYGTGGYMTSVSEALSHNRDAIGIGRKGTIDKPYLLKAPFWTVDTLFYAIPKSDINLEFALCSFSNVDWKSKDESTGLPSLSKESINETVLSVPNVVEQNHLGSFFADLDRLITLHQRKLELLQNIKKSLLDKMFV